MREGLDSKLWQERTLLLLGDEALKAYRESHILLVGCGGVGGFVAEMLARAGVGRLTLVDADVVQPSNINRQIVALHSTLGEAKVDVLERRLKDINPEIEIIKEALFLKDDNIPELLDRAPYSFVVDAIDTLSPKVFLIKAVLERGLPLISSMGAGAKTDPMKIHIADLARSRNCSLARFVRKRLKALGIRGGFPVVYSEELPRESAIVFTENEQNKKTTAGTISYMPALFGLQIAAYVLNKIAEGHE